MEKLNKYDDVEKTAISDDYIPAVFML